MEEKATGKVIHYFDKAMVAVIALDANLTIGDNVKFVHGDKEFSQTIKSMQIEHKQIDSAKKGEEVAVKVEQEVYKGTKIYKDK
jgi:putative protease